MWKKQSGLDNIKFMIKPFNDSTVILRIHNLNDKSLHNIGLYANKTSTFLTSYYGKKAIFSEII
jgi:hypothetical protein